MKWETFCQKVESLEKESYAICERLFRRDVVVIPAGRFYRLSIESLSQWDIDVQYVVDRKPHLSDGANPWFFMDREYVAEKEDTFVKAYGNSVNYIITSRPHRYEIENQLLTMGIEKDNIFYMPIRLGNLVPRSVFKRRHIIKKSFDDINSASMMLEDEQSRDQLWDLLSFFYANAPVWKEQVFSEEYFNTPYIQLGEKEVFVDAGVFDGETSLRFAELCPTYEAIYGIEANPYNMDMIYSKTAGLRDIHLYNNALCNEETLLTFSQKNVGIEGAHLTSDGEISVTGMRGDSLNIIPTFIKLDIEGAEYDALNGFNNTIASYQPKLAVSVYHSLEDHWRLISLVKHMYSGYKLFLKHHYGYEDLYGTILYATK